MKAIKKFMKQKVSGLGIIEIILILVIIIGLILIFRTQIEAIIQTAFSSINSNADAINGEITLTTP